MTNAIPAAQPTPALAGTTPAISEVLTANKALLLASLAKMGATRAVIDYSGSGDDGAIQSVCVEVLAGSAYDSSAAVNVFVVRSTFQGGAWSSRVALEEQEIDAALLEFADRAVDRHHPGYCNGDGGEGEVIFCVADRSVRIEHRDFYTECDNTDTEL